MGNPQEKPLGGLSTSPGMEMELKKNLPKFLLWLLDLWKVNVVKAEAGGSIPSPSHASQNPGACCSSSLRTGAAAAAVPGAGNSPVSPQLAHPIPGLWTGNSLSTPAFPSASHPAGTGTGMRCVSIGTNHSSWLLFPENSLASVPCLVLPARTRERIQDEDRV